MSSMRPERWLLWAGLGTWLAANVPAVIAVSNGSLSGARQAAWAIASIGFLFSFARRPSPSGVSAPPGVIALRLIGQAVSGLVMVGAARDTLASGTLLVVVAGQLLSLLPPWGAGIWIGVQTLALIATFRLFLPWVPAATIGTAFGGFQLFALGTAALAQRERRAHQALAAANTELHANRLSMAAHSRAEERLRIARDLHDTLGHHLTALNLQLDVASRLSDGKAAAHLDEAHALARLLLADVRNAVGSLREVEPANLGQAIRALTAGPTGGLTVHLDAASDVHVAGAAQAHALLRCVQEILTNAIRHSQAAHLWITVEVGLDGVTVCGRDDGRGAGTVSWGHGLSGMRERVEALHGRLDVSTRAGDGFEVRAFVPRSMETV